jgi:UDP-GlcNAc:undecaprenyl-phosphate GlcNAc-1-phosphate transferase
MSTPALSALAGVVAFAATALLVPLVRGAAIAAGQVTQVMQDRWHRIPTPNLGGIGIFLGFLLVMIRMNPC